MQTHRRQRLVLFCWIFGFLAIGVAAILYALRDNINVYMTPSEYQQQSWSPSRTLQLGGMVSSGSFHRDGLLVHFVLTDFKAQVLVRYHGILPSLFREGQGVIAIGHYVDKKHFIANELLAKHDENYHPPGMPPAATTKRRK